VCDAPLCRAPEYPSFDGIDKDSYMATELELLREYIRNETGYDGELDADADLLEGKILDSFNIVELAMFIQDRFEIELEAEDLVRANLSKLSSMLALIERKKAARTS
jgi:acyl carrier protein